MLGKILVALILVQGQGNQGTNGVIRGQILIASTRISERIPVTIQRSEGPIVARIFSDSLGNYEARGLSAGSYEILVNIEGFEEVRQQVVIGGNGLFSSATVNIPMREKEKFIIIKPDHGAMDDLVDVTELSRKYPKKAVQDYEKALGELKKSNDAKATELLLSVVKLAPDFYSAHNTLGTLYQRTNRFREAEVEYRRASALNPRAADPMVNLGSLFIQEAATRTREGEEVIGKILDNALDILEASLKLKRSAPAYYLLGTAYFRSSFYKEAESNLKRAIEVDPHLSNTRLMLANLYIKQRQWPKALEQLDTYLAENPKTADHTQIEDTRAKVVQRIR